MGICYSILDKKKQNLINQCETLNQSILFLETIENRTKQMKKKLFRFSAKSFKLESEEKCENGGELESGKLLLIEIIHYREKNILLLCKLLKY